MAITVSSRAHIRVKVHYTVDGVMTNFADVVTVPFDYMTGEVHDALRKLHEADNIQINGKAPKIKSVFLIMPVGD